MSRQKGDIMSRYAYGNKYGVTHGFSKTHLYKIWINMRSRCYCKSATRYERYGERGITVCEEWKNDFLAFRKWAYENGYEDGLSIERIDINSNYCPENCKWILKPEQSKNTSRTHWVTHNGETKCVEDWCKELGLKSNTILNRAKKLENDFYKAIFEYKPYVKNQKEYCPKGHKYTEDNSAYNSSGYRYCKICFSEKNKEYKKRKKNNEKCIDKH